VLKDGEPLLYSNDTKGIGFDHKTLKPFVIDLEKEPGRKDEVLIHDEKDESGLMATVYANMDWPEFPVPIGVFRAHEKPAYDAQVVAQNKLALEKNGEPNLHDLLYAGDTWTVE
jgi:2-oxoglutarate ferredoxin oxidoreductase subunit beta